MRTRRARRRIWLAAATMALTALAMTSVAGCGKMGAALSQSWGDVVFKEGTSAATALHVRQACAKVPNVTLAPIPRQTPQADIVASVRFYTTNASVANQAELQICLTKFPSVLGINFDDASDDGD